MKFTAGNNIAMKVPYHQYEQTVHFYRDIIRLPEKKEFNATGIIRIIGNFITNNSKN